MTARAARLAANLRAVQTRIARACDAAGRDPAGLTLIAITKYVGIDDVRALLDLGLRDFGENRWQVAEPKVEALAEQAVWHFVGPVQKNKLSKLVPVFAVYHAIESAEIAAALAARVPPGERRAIFVQVNVSGEPQKHGVAVPVLPALLAAVEELPALEPRGLMTMAPLTDDETVLRTVFRTLARLRPKVESPPEAPAGRDDRPGAPARWQALSMGMSQDFEHAIAFGATHLRIGSLLYEGLEG